MLKLDQAVFGYGQTPIVRCDSMTVEPGDVIGLVGDNGSGKSTLLKGIVGLAQMLGGQASIGGRSISGLRTSERIKSGIAFHPQRGRVFELLSVRDNLRVGYERRNGRAPEAFGDRLLRLAEDLPGIEDILDRPGHLLSGGERQLTGVARCILQTPKLMLLDEPTAALDPTNEEAVVLLLRKVSQERRTALLIAEHNRDFLKKVRTATAWRVHEGRMEAWR